MQSHSMLTASVETYFIRKKRIGDCIRRDNILFKTEELSQIHTVLLQKVVNLEGSSLISNMYNMSNMWLQICDFPLVM